MRQTVFNLAALVCALLFLVATWQWLRSHLGEVIIVDSRPGQLLLIGVDAPRVRVHAAREIYTTEHFLELLLKPPRLVGMAPIPPAVEHRTLGFWLARGDLGRIPYRTPSGASASLYCPFWIVGVPYAFIAVPGAVLPAAWLWRRHRLALRRRSNGCVHCGYDLRGTPDRCPECGTTSAAAT